MGNLGGKKCRIFPRLDRIRTFNPRHFVTVSEKCSICPHVTGWMNGPAKCTFVVVRCTEGRRLSNANGNNGIYDGAVEALSSLFPQFFAEKSSAFPTTNDVFPLYFRLLTDQCSLCMKRGECIFEGFSDRCAVVLWIVFLSATKSDSVLGNKYGSGTGNGNFIAQTMSK